jgi:hypothetical protein
MRRSRLWTDVSDVADKATSFLGACGLAIQSRKQRPQLAGRSAEDGCQAQR